MNRDIQTELEDFLLWDLPVSLDAIRLAMSWIDTDFCAVDSPQSAGLTRISDELAMLRKRCAELRIGARQTPAGRETGADGPTNTLPVDLDTSAQSPVTLGPGTKIKVRKDRTAPASSTSNLGDSIDGLLTTAMRARGERAARPPQSGSGASNGAG